MRLTWRDGVATLLGALGGVFAVAVLQEWGWPLLGGYDSGTLAVGAIGLAMCGIGGYAFWNSVFARPGPVLRDPFVIIGAILGLAVTAVAVIGLIAPTRTAFVWMVGLVAALWAVATIRHTVEITTTGSRPAIHAAH